MTEQRMTIGDHNVVIQNTGNDVTIAVGASSLTLVRRHHIELRAPPLAGPLWLSGSVPMLPFLPTIRTNFSTDVNGFLTFHR